MNILFINATVREESRTLVLAKEVLKKLKSLSFAGEAFFEGIGKSEEGISKYIRARKPREHNSFGKRTEKTKRQELFELQ